MFLLSKIKKQNHKIKHSPLISEAIKQSNQLLEKYSIPLKASVFHIEQPLTPPFNKHIDRLCALHLMLRENLENILASQNQDLLPITQNFLYEQQIEIWNTKTVRTLVTELLHTGLAISYLSFQELPKYKKEIQKSELNLTNTNILTNQSIYISQIFFFVPIAYNMLRSQMLIDEHNYFIYPKNSSQQTKAFNQLFFTPGTEEYYLRSLYSEYVQLVQQVTSLKDLKKYNQNYCKWIQEDCPKKPFKYFPTSLPRANLAFTPHMY